MPRPTRTLPLEIVRDHLVARIGRAAALIDTGSPMTFRAPALLTEQLGQPIRWLVGTDALARHRVLLDWRGRRLVLGGPALPGETIPLVPHAGLHQVRVDGAHGTALAFLDTGAHVSYAPASVVRGLAPVARSTDFYPLFGEYEVDIFELVVTVGRRRIHGRFAVLPELLAMLLSGLGGSGWILGSDFFRDRAIQLDLAHDRLVDATASAPRQRTTRRRDAGAEIVAETTNAVAAAPIEGWRGWRLTDIDSLPHLQSISARDVWEGPCFTADVRPTVQRVRETTGVHAYATPGQMQSVLRGPALVYGQVTLFGEICVHEMGYRAEHARVDRLFLRACGQHAPARAPLTGLIILDAVSQVPGAYCCCDALEHEEWLTYDQLEAIARQLGDRYQCDVTVDAERGRTPSYACSRARRAAQPRARRA